MARHCPYPFQKRYKVDPTFHMNHKPQLVFSYVDESLGCCTEVRDVSPTCAQALFPGKKIKKSTCQHRGYTKFMNENTINQSPVFISDDINPPCLNQYAVWSKWLQ